MNYRIEELKKLLTNKLTPDVFITLNNGELIDIYSSSNILPNTLEDYEKFNIFIKDYLLIFNLMDIDYEMIEKLKYKDVEFINSLFMNNTEYKIETKTENFEQDDDMQGKIMKGIAGFYYVDISE